MSIKDNIDLAEESSGDKKIGQEPENDEEQLEIKDPEDDADFDLKEEDDDEEDYEEEEDDEEEGRQRSRSRSKKSTPASHDDQDEDDDEDLDDHEEGEPDLGEDEEGRAIKKPKKEKKVKGRRGRKPNVSLLPLFDDDGKVYEVVNDEYLLPEDADGETKISKDGELQGGRLFRVRTFTVKGKGDRLYMLSTEPARCMGFRDSYLLFQRHRLLYKIVLTQDEKYDLIDREIIPYSYKGRTISLVTARSIFREFGARIIVGGRHITDDYFVQKAKERGGVKEGELADPTDIIPNKGSEYNKNQFVAWHGASNVYHSTPYVPQPQYYEPLELKSIKTLKNATNMNEDSWIFEHASAVRRYERELLKKRLLISRGTRDPYTGITFVPQSTQPSRTEIAKVIGTKEDISRKKLVYETVVKSNSLSKFTGLADVSLDIFKGTVDEETFNAIVKQQELEKRELI